MYLTYLALPIKRLLSRMGNLNLSVKQCVFVLGMMSLFLNSASAVEMEGFDRTPVGRPPAGWSVGVTGEGHALWSVEKDGTAPSSPNVLKQSGQGTFVWGVKDGTAMRNGAVEVRFKPVAGSEDQAGGVVWRFQDANNYYITRANALEDNVTIYHMLNGRRTAFGSANVKVSPMQWHSLRVEFEGGRFLVYFDGRQVLAAQDEHITVAGLVGLWTKADSVTLFDNFSYVAK